MTSKTQPTNPPCTTSSRRTHLTVTGPLQDWSGHFRRRFDITTTIDELLSLRSTKPRRVFAKRCRRPPYASMAVHDTLQLCRPWLLDYRADSIRQFRKPPPWFKPLIGLNWEF
ncbi:hypothetical protein M0R45_032157 [Rubus argutus]|uniref:Uncharacterized protein n=1 Tax=Rubus argutus TaxID=59490 RepID=A0AAW1WIW8_RUBAR